MLHIIGNCESFISQDLIAIARPKGPTFGYNDSNGILLAGPNDLSSNKANTSFDTTNGVTLEEPKFLSPDEMIDMTRHGHNEFSFERLLFDKKSNSFRKRMPSYVLWIEEEKTDGLTEKQIREKREQDDRWQMTKKAAAQLGIPIVVINREYFAEKEQSNIEDMQAKLMGEKELDEGESKEQLIENLIVKFENNAIGLMYADAKVKSKYFTEVQRTNNFSIIEQSLEKMKSENPIEYKRCLTKFIKSLKAEVEKYEYASAQPPQAISELLEKYKSIEDRNKDFDPILTPADAAEVSSASAHFEQQLRSEIAREEQQI